MTREEAIARIRDHKIVHEMNEPRAIYISEALDMAIKALEQEPSEDCISREQAIKATYGFERYTGIDEAPYEYAENILRDLPPVTPKQTRWIPVSERLPDKNGRYLVTVKQGYVTFGAWIDVAENWAQVTAWMPLPEPYRGETE